MPYARRRRVSRKRASARAGRPKSAVKRSFKRPTLIPRKSKPEIKVNQIYYPLATLNSPATTFTDTYPASDATFNLVDTMPGIGNEYYQRTGNQITRIGYQVDLYFTCSDPNVDARFVLFRWESTQNPDVAQWLSPLDGSNTTAGAGWNTWFPAKSTSMYTVLYQKAWRFGNRAAQTGTLPRYHVKKFIKCNQVVSAVQSNGQPNAMAAGSIGTVTSYKGRIYWAVVTTNIADADIALFGYCRHFYLDS